LSKKNLVAKTALLLSAVLAANCGDDNSSSDGGGSGGVGKGGSVSKGGSTGKGGSTSKGGSTGKGGTDAGGAAGEAGAPTSAGSAGDGSAGDGNAGGGAGGTASTCPQSLDDFPAVYAQAICDKREECCAVNAATCLEDVTAALVEAYPELGQSQEDGEVVLDCTDYDACVDAIAAASCSEWPKELGAVYGIPVDEPACRSMFRGQIAATDPCLADYQCDHGYCETSINNMIDPECVILVPDGQPCGGGFDQVCDLSRSYCNSDNECAPRLANGEACANAGQCQSRICDTGAGGAAGAGGEGGAAVMGECIAPSAAQCEYVPADACSMSSGRVPGGAGWPLAFGALLLGAIARRRRFVSL
jgi:hypothetical protein